ncbi:MAG: dephospho-CoA kinase [Gammaproteobacteria bacterium]|nr:dephospho-CoA kinase [Gammaproteobacteria bacterium]
MARRLRIGLTGGIASGKSTAAQRFIELGIPVIDADEVARAVVLPGQPGLARVVEKFGPDVLAADGSLDRRALRNKVFSDPASRTDLEGILHPLIRAEMERRAAAAGGDSYVVMAIPLLVESGRRDRIDRILVVDVDESVQLQRLMTRDSSSLDQARAILAAQASRADRLQAADDVLLNSGTVSELQQAVDRLHERYLGLAAAHSPQK